MTCELTLEEEEAKVSISTLRSKVGFGFSTEEDVEKGSSNQSPISRISCAGQ